MEKIPNPDKNLKLTRLIEIREYLKNIKDKTPINNGDIVTVVEGPYANLGLKVIEKKDDGSVVILPDIDAQPVSIAESELYHIKDFKAAFKYSLVQHPGMDDEQRAEAELN